MPIYTFPAIPIARATLKLVPNTQIFESDLNRAGQVLSLPGDRWVGELTIADLLGYDARHFSAFVALLRGRVGRFYISPPGCGTPGGTALGSGVVSGTGQTGASLATSGWTPNQAALLLPGDYFSISYDNGTTYELKQMYSTAASDGSGNATLNFTPPLRRSPLDGSAIITTNPCMVAMCQDDNQGGFEISGPRIYAFNFAFMEALDI